MGFWDRVGVRSYHGGDGTGAASTPQGDAGRADPGATETKSVVLGINDVFGSLLAVGQSGTLATPGAAMRAFEASADVAIPIMMIAESAAEPPLIMKNLRTGERVRSHPMLDLMRRPHAEFSKQRFVETAVKHYLVAGECPLVAFGFVDAPPQAVLPISPTWIWPNPSDLDGMVSSWEVISPAGRGLYRVEERNARDRRFYADRLRELKVIKAFSTRDNALVRGQSRLQSVSKMVWQGMQGDDYNMALLQNGGRFSLIFSFKGSMQRDVYAEAARQIRSQFGGPTRAGSVVVTQGGELDVKEAAATSRDIEFTEGQRRVAHALFLAYRVPLALVTTEASTFNNYTTAIRAFWDEAVSPALGRVLGEIGEWLGPRYGLDPSEWALSYDENEVPALLERWLEQLHKRAQLGLESIDEIRETMPGRGPVVGGGEILVQGSLVPLSAIAEPLDEGDPNAGPIRAPGAGPETDPDDEEPDDDVDE